MDATNSHNANDYSVVLRSNGRHKLNPAIFIGVFHCCSKFGIFTGMNIPTKSVVSKIAASAVLALVLSAAYFFLNTASISCCRAPQAETPSTQNYGAATSTALTLYANYQLGFKVIYPGDYIYTVDTSSLINPVTKADLGRLAIIHFGPSPIQSDKNWREDISVWNTKIYALDNMLNDVKDAGVNGKESLTVIPGGEMHEIAYTIPREANSGSVERKTFIIVNNKLGIAYETDNEDLASSFEFIGVASSVDPYSYPKSSEPGNSLSVSQLLNAPVPDFDTNFSGSGAAFKNGEYRSYGTGSNSDNAGDVTASVSLNTRETTYSYGDLSGDGANDMAATLISNTGGTGWFSYLVVYINKNGAPEYVGSVFLGDRITINGISIHNRIISADIVTQGPGEAMCCGTLRKTIRYELLGNLLRKI